MNQFSEMALYQYGMLSEKCLQSAQGSTHVQSAVRIKFRIALLSTFRTREPLNTCSRSRVCRQGNVCFMTMEDSLLEKSSSALLLPGQYDDC